MEWIFFYHSSKGRGFEPVQAKRKGFEPIQTKKGKGYCSKKCNRKTRGHGLKILN